MKSTEDMQEIIEDETPLFTPMSEDELASVVMNEISRGIGGNVSSDSDVDISIPLDYYLGRLPGLSKVRAKDKNASRFVSQDIMDAVEATVSEIMPAFTADQVGIYEPESQQDEEAAREETDIVNYLLMEEYDGYTLIQQAVKDACLHRNCTIKAYWDERVEVEYETFDDVPEMALADILTPEDDNQTIEVVEQYVSEEADLQAEAYVSSQQHAMDMQNLQMAGQDPNMQQNPELQQGMAQMQQTMQDAQDKYSIKIKRMTKVGKPVIDAIPPENVIVGGEHWTPVLQDARFAAHELIETRSSLIEQGFDPAIVNTLSEYNSNVDNVSRGREPEEYDYTSAHESTRFVRVFEAYINVDFDGDGIAERRKVVVASNKVLSNEEYDGVAMIGGAITIMPHKYKGISLFDRLKDIQDAKTPIMRSIIDGTQLSSNPRIGVVTGGGVNIDDLLTSRTGGLVRMDSANNIVQVPNPEIPQSSYQFLEHMDNIRRDRGGGAVDTASQAMQVGNDTAHGIERVISSMELGNAMLARTIGETLIRGIFVELHNILRKNYKGSITAQIGGRWIETVPERWKKRTSVTIHVGSSHAERARQAGVMNGIVMSQQELAMAGSTMYSLDRHYKALVEVVRLSGISNPESYYVDPTSEEGQQAQQAQSQQQSEAQQKEEMMQQQIVEAQDKLGQAELNKAQADLQNNQIKFQNEQLKAEITALKNHMDATGKADELQLKREKQADDVALKLTELELQANRDLSEQYEDNTEDSEVGIEESETEGES